MRAWSVLLVSFAGLVVAGCNDNGTSPDNNRGHMLPNSLASATQVDTVNATAVLPLYRGLDASGGSVYYIITESNDIEESVRLGVNWTPKLVHALNTIAVQKAT
ncbi:MAG: hypothetical protein ABJC63_13270, partial [Gemmatimonadales bacterium]